MLDLVRMTRSAKATSKRGRPTGKTVVRGGRWVFQDAKARLSEVVRRARDEGPQHVSVRGKEGVVIVAEGEFRRLKGDLTGAALVAALQASPERETELEPKRLRMPVRDVSLR